MHSSHVIVILTDENNILFAFLEIYAFIVLLPFIF